MVVRLGRMTGERGPRPGSGPHVVVVEVTGVLDMDACPALQAKLSRALSLHHPPLLALGLGGATCADSYGLTVLLAADRHARERGGRMVAYGAGLTLRKTLRERGVDRVIDVRPSLADALRELRAVR